MCSAGSGVEWHRPPQDRQTALLHQCHLSQKFVHQPWWAPERMAYYSNHSIITCSPMYIIYIYAYIYIYILYIYIFKLRYYINHASLWWKNPNIFHCREVKVCFKSSSWATGHLCTSLVLFVPHLQEQY